MIRAILDMMALNLPIKGENERIAQGLYKLPTNAKELLKPLKTLWKTKK